MSETKQITIIKKPNKSYVVEIQGSSALADYIKQHDVVVVDFFATWCKYCKEIEPSYEEHAYHFSKIINSDKSVKFVKCDVDVWDDCELEEWEVQQNQFEVDALPCVALYKNGKYIDRWEGSDVVLNNIVAKI